MSVPMSIENTTVDKASCAEHCSRNADGEVNSKYEYKYFGLQKLDDGYLCVCENEWNRVNMYGSCESESDDCIVSARPRTCTCT